MKKILIHSCCAPCASWVIQKTREEGYLPIVFFYNPNIHPFAEYKKRKIELQKYCKQEKIEFIEGVDGRRFWSQVCVPFRKEPEGRKRCLLCFRLRLAEVAREAKNRKITIFTSTLSISPHKSFTAIAEIGKQVGRALNIDFLDIDWKKNDGFKKSCEISKKQNFYRQNYCGCIFSQKSK